ncbi:MAG: hypothetical protein JWQ09_4434 [Segetibacter sp.]|nr:hypothetical protein [Segetibacter sp.]
MVKKFFIFITFLSISSRVLCQETFDDYKSAYEKLDVTQVSGSMLYMLNDRMRSIDNNRYTEFIQNKRQAIYQKFDLGTKNHQQKFLENYNENLSKLKKEILGKDILLHVNPELIANYGSDVLSRYQGNNSSEYINTLLQPIIKSKLNEYTNFIIDSIAKEVLNNKAKLEALSEQIVAYWKTKRANITSF